MPNLVTLIGKGFNKHMTQIARRRTLEVLARQSDSTLRDIGVSRELLNGGPDNWPWPSNERSTQATTAQPGSPKAASTYHKIMKKAQAIRELRACSDRELRDLGITRQSIVEAVNHGRPGIEQPFFNKPKPAQPTTNNNQPAALSATATKSLNLLDVSSARQRTDDIVSTQSPATSDDRQAA